MTQLSIEAFTTVKESGKLKESQIRVVKYLMAREHIGTTIREYCEAHGCTPNTVSGRFSELYHEGIIYIAGRRHHHSVYFYESDRVRRAGHKYLASNNDLNNLIKGIKRYFKKYPFMRKKAIRKIFGLLT